MYEPNETPVYWALGTKPSTMNQVFILQNQHQYFLSKSGEWLDGRDGQSLYRTPHKDEALNQMVEVNSKDYMQRIQIVACELDEKKRLLIPADWLPPLVEVTEAQAEAADDKAGTTVTTQSNTTETTDADKAENLAAEADSKAGTPDIFQD